MITLLVVTLLSVVVTEFTYSTEVSSHLTRNTLNATQAHYLARSGVRLAELALVQDLEEDQDPENPRRGADTLQDPWAAPFPPMQVGNGHGEASFSVLDERSRFNLNALSQGAGRANLERNKELFQAILSFLGLDTNLLFPLVDWLDPGDERASESGAESPHYLGLRPPRVPRNGPLLTVEEVTLVKGFDELTANEWRNLRQLVTVFPRSGRGNEDLLAINVNTASEMLLTAILAHYGSAEVAANLVRERDTEPFRDANDVRRRIAGIDQLPRSVSGIFTNVDSSLYTIYGTGRAAGLERTLAVTVERSEAARGRQPPSLETLRWTEHTGPVPLTSPEPSDEMTRDLF